MRLEITPRTRFCVRAAGVDRRSGRTLSQDDGLERLEVAAIRITFGRCNVAALTELVPGVHEDQPLLRCLLRVRVHPIDGRLQEQPKSGRRTIGEIPSRLLAQP